MVPTPKMLMSAAAAGAIMLGGIAIAANASASLLEDTTAVPVQMKTQSDASPSATPSPAPSYVVTHEQKGDPLDVADYWTEDRMRDAKPLTPPELKIEIKPTE